MPEWIGQGNQRWMQLIRGASEGVMNFMVVPKMRGFVDAAEYRQLMVEMMPGRAECVMVCAKVVVEEKFIGGETEPDEAECELGVQS